MFMQRDMRLKSVSTFEWDLVASIRIDALNRAIVEGGRTPEGFSGTTSEGARVAARFEPWQISDDSDGAILCMTMGLADLEIADGGEAHQFDEAVASVDLRLTYLPHEPDAVGPARTMLLVVDDGVRASERAPVSVTGMRIRGPHKMMDEINAMAALEVWLKENLAAFSHVLAAVTLYESVKEDARFKWMKPTYLAYAFGRDALDPGQSVLSILSQTCGRSAKKLPHQTLADAIPDGAEAGFLVSRKRFLNDVILPALPAAFPGLSAGELTILQDDAGVELAAPPVHLEEIDYDGDIYEPDLMRLEVNLYDTYLDMVTETRTKVSLGVWAHCRMSGRYGLELVTKGGKRSMTVVQHGEPSVRKWKEVDKGVDITKKILLVIGAIAAIIIGICTFGYGVAAAAPVYYALYGSMIGFTALQASEIFSGETSPPLDLLETEIDETLTWSTGTVFTPTSIGLHHALQIGGTTKGDRRLKGVDGVSPARAFQERFAARMRGHAA